MAGRTDRASLLLHADAARVFRALTDADELLRWLPPAGMTGRFERFEMRAGGSFRLVLTYDDATDAVGKSTGDSDVSEVRIVELVPDRLVVQRAGFVSDDPAFAGTMELRWTLTPDPEGAVLEIEARNVPPGVGARDHAAGMLSSLTQLAAHLEP